MNYRIKAHISLSIRLFFGMSPLVRESKPGIRPGSGKGSKSVAYLKPQRGKGLTLDHETHKLLRITSDVEELDLVPG